MWCSAMFADCEVMQGPGAEAAVCGKIGRPELAIGFDLSRHEVI